MRCLNIGKGGVTCPAGRMPRARLFTSVSGGNTGDEVPHGEDIHSVPLHIDVPRESDRPVHGGDLLTLLTQPKNMLPTPGDSVGLSSEGVYIGEGLPRSLQNSRTR